MPLFEYLCKKCSKITEVLFHPGDTREDITCEHCGHTQLDRQLSTVNVASGRSRSLPSCDSCPGSSGSGQPPPCAGSDSCSL